MRGVLYFLVLLLFLSEGVGSTFWSTHQNLDRHREEPQATWRSSLFKKPGLLRYARNDGSGSGASSSELDAAIGRALFKRAWVPAPSSTLANDGLGPLFNARACTGCHAGLDRPNSAEKPDSLVLRLSDSEGRPDPVYGLQLQTSAVQGFVPETDFPYGPLAPQTRQGRRITPGLRGVGLLARVPDAQILAHADPDDKDGDGISGRVNWVEGKIGRFGWKAGQPTLEAQADAAFSLDIGMSTPGRPDPAGDCTAAQTACQAGPHGGTLKQDQQKWEPVLRSGLRQEKNGAPEIPGELVARLVAYLDTVAPPPAPAPDEVGMRLFASTGCASCHVPKLGEAQAFTDLLLHDMGPGLDGGATEPGVAPTEWRTAPLWGINKALAAGAGLLHDGRAKDVASAVAAHGGEAERARQNFEALPEADKARLLRYVEGL